MHKNHILRSTSSTSIKPAIVNSIYNLFNTVAKCENSVLHTSNDVYWIKSNTSRWPNLIFDATFDSAKLEKRVHQITEQIISGIAPSMWLVEEKDSSKMLSYYLKSYGYIICEEWCGMAIDLDRLNSKHSLINNFSVKKVTNTSMLRYWLDITSTAFFRGQKLNEKMFKDLASNHDVEFFMGFSNNIPVATSLLHYSCGAAGIYFVSVYPEFRNHGYGTTITAASLFEAKKAGYHVGLLQATPMGERIYNKLGFEKYSKFNLFKLQDPYQKKISP